ncbi:hypothetical protein IK146_00825 [Candidatus Saccharibacteria bacterium]|nr:hypothetical protein [Candidatus Saccharibacteria bacterium]
MADNCSYTREEIVAAVRGNNAEKVGEILEKCGALTKDNKVPCVTSCSQNLMRVTLGLAAHMSMHDSLSYELAVELIERTAMAVTLFPILQLIAECLELEGENSETATFETIPENVREALANNKYDDEVDSVIRKMVEGEAKTLIKFILLCDDVKKLDKPFNRPILRAIYENSLIPDVELLTFMMAHPCDILRESSGIAIMVGGGLLGLGMLMGVALAEDIEADDGSDTDDTGEASDANDAGNPNSNLQ